MPQGIAGTQQVLAYIANEISRNTYLNVMGQYRPCYRTDEYPQIDRPTTPEEYRDALDTAARLGRNRLDQRAARTAA